MRKFDKKVLPNPNSTAYSLIEAVDSYTDVNISLENIYGIYHLVEENKIFDTNIINSFPFLVSFPVVFEKLKSKYILSSFNKQDYKDLFTNLLYFCDSSLNFWLKIDEKYDTKVFRTTFLENQPTEVEQIVAKEPRTQEIIKEKATELSLDFIFSDMANYKTKIKIFCTTFFFSVKLRRDYLGKQRVITNTLPEDLMDVLPLRETNPTKHLDNFKAFLKKKKEEKKDERTSAQAQLKEIQEKKEIEFGDFSKFATLKEQDTTEKNSDIDMIIREAIQSHKQAIENFAKLDETINKKLKESWEDFIVEFPFIKTYKMFDEFSENPVIYFIKHRIHKIDVDEIVRNFSRLLIRYFNFVKIDGYVINKKHLLMGKAVQDSTSKYLPIVDTEGSALLSLQDKNIYFMINNKLMKKKSGFSLSEEEIKIMEYAIIDFLKVKRFETNSIDIRKLLSDELEKVVKKVE